MIVRQSSFFHVQECVCVCGLFARQSKSSHSVRGPSRLTTEMHYLSTEATCDPALQSSLTIAGLELEADAVNAVALIRGGREPLALEDMAQVSSTGIAHNLDPVAVGIRVSSNSSGDRIKESRPATARVELGRRGVQGCLAARTRVHALVRVLVVLARVGSLGALLAQDTELLRAEHGAPFLIGLLVGHGIGGCVVGVDGSSSVGSFARQEREHANSGKG